jgi:hypothetical protein
MEQCWGRGKDCHNKVLTRCTQEYVAKYQGTAALGTSSAKAIRQVLGGTDSAHNPRCFRGLQHSIVDWIGCHRVGTTGQRHHRTHENQARNHLNYVAAVAESINHGQHLPTLCNHVNACSFKQTLFCRESENVTFRNAVP